MMQPFSRAFAKHITSKSSLCNAVCINLYFNDPFRQKPISDPITNYTNYQQKCLFASSNNNNQMKEIDSSKLQIKLTKNAKPKTAYKELKFGITFTDHMLEINWTKEYGWENPKIAPFNYLRIHPAANGLHYALQAFEGMKAYRDSNDQIRMFRPDMNWNRLNESCKALVFPTINCNEMQKCVEKLLTVDKEWIPNIDGYSLYLRPTIISTHRRLALGMSDRVKLYVIMSPVGPYYPEGFAAVSLWATDEYVRAWPGGTGSFKLGANYGPTLPAQLDASQKGYSGVMWLFPVVSDNNTIRYRIEEVGTMNLFIFWINKQTGKKELVTSKLKGTVLPGITRDSVLTLAKQYKEFDVCEKDIFMDEVISASKENRILEVFGSGTAAIISPVRQIAFKNEIVNIPLNPNDPTEQAGILAKRVWNDIVDIQYGKKKHPWSVVVDEKLVLEKY